MGVQHKLTVDKTAAKLGCPMSNVQRLIKRKHNNAVRQNAPVKYYLVDPESIEKYKTTPRNKGGRPQGKLTQE